MKPPSKLLWAAELPRGLWGAASLLGAHALLREAARGDGRPVLLLPGLFNGDRSNIVLRRYLRWLGYDARGWGLGRNFGTRTVGPEAERLLAAVAALHAETGERVTLIGVSLGGIMARLAAHRLPASVREVVTISSPFAGLASATNVWRAFELLSGERVTSPRVLRQSAEAARPLAVPATAIWSRSDGLVAGAICRDQHGDAVEVRSNHIFVQLRPQVLRTVADVLGRSARGPR